VDIAGSVNGASMSNHKVGWLVVVRSMEQDSLAADNLREGAIRLVEIIYFECGLSKTISEYFSRIEVPYLFYVCFLSVIHLKRSQIQ
jgi:hypothetical protein